MKEIKGKIFNRKQTTQNYSSRLKIQKIICPYIRNKIFFQWSL